jgi:arylsulfatase A-like enzyme/Flp pilus assembly protein TadD
VLLTTLFACSDPQPGVAVPAGTRPDVVLVTLDTTRADRLGAYGHAQAKTPVIDGLAARGIRFDQALSPLPLTIPAHATIMTGLFPFNHGIRSNGDNVLAPSFTTLAEHLRDNGWATGASVAAFVTTRQWGFSQGFQAYFDSLPETEDKNYWHTERSGEQVVDDALAWVSVVPQDQPVFLWVHLYDAHFPYVAKEPFATELKDRPYDAELAYVDKQVGRLVDAFADRPALFVLVGDHGEALGEHDELTHGLYTYQATQRVPFIVAGEGVTPGVVTEPVSSADVTPTVLAALGLPVPEGLDGKPQPGSPQVPYAESYQLAERFRIAPHRAVVEGNLKLVASPKPELYDLVADPGEKTNLAEQRPDDVARLVKLLEEKDAKPPGAGIELDAETVSQLAALGYVTGGAEAGIDPFSLPDAKDYAAFLAGANRLERASRSPEEALAAIDALLALKPDAFELRMRRLPLLARAGRAEEARVFMDETSALFPDRARVWVTLGQMAMREGSFEEALADARKALEIDPKDPSAVETEVEALFRLKRTEEAVARGEAAMAANEKSYGVAALLGHHYLNAKVFDKAETNLRIAVSGPNPRRAARHQLALLAIAAGVKGDAFSLLEAEVKDYPGNVASRRLLARLFGEEQNWLGQLEHVAYVARVSPNDAEAQRQLAQCQFNLQDYRAARVALDDAIALAADDADVLLLHANLLQKEGVPREQILPVVERAKAAHQQRLLKAGVAADEAAKGDVVENAASGMVMGAGEPAPAGAVTPPGSPASPASSGSPASPASSGSPPSSGSPASPTEKR